LPDSVEVTITQRSMVLAGRRRHAMDGQWRNASHVTPQYGKIPRPSLNSDRRNPCGPSAYIAKVMGVFVSMDKMIGTDFETGLANLKTVAET
jgi:hypothetical protein